MDWLACGLTYGNAWMRPRQYISQVAHHFIRWHPAHHALPHIAHHALNDYLVWFASPTWGKITELRNARPQCWRQINIIRCLHIEDMYGSRWLPGGYVKTAMLGTQKDNPMCPINSRSWLFCHVYLETAKTFSVTFHVGPKLRYIRTIRPFTTFSGTFHVVFRSLFRSLFMSLFRRPLMLSLAGSCTPSRCMIQRLLFKMQSPSTESVAVLFCLVFWMPLLFVRDRSICSARSWARLKVY